ncbi:MAG: hypothetical protein MZV63_23545 [Marinilabiliales bacterium]|nr:hypothetical protein [Marinilabiliales bacterium]
MRGHRRRRSCTSTTTSATGSTQTDNLIYDPSLKPYESNGKRERHARRPLGLHGDVVAASRTTRASARWPRPAARCAATTTRWRPSAWPSRRRPTPRSALAAAPSAPADRLRGARSASGAELRRVLQLMIATKEQPYADRFDELVWPALDRGARSSPLAAAVRAIPFMDPRVHGEAACRTSRKYRTELDGMHKQNPYGVPIGTAAAGPATRRSSAGRRRTTTCTRRYPGPRRRASSVTRRPRLPLRHATRRRNVLVRLRRREPLQARRLRQQPGGLHVHRRRRRAGRPGAQARLPGEHGRLAVPLGRERRHDRRRVAVPGAVDSVCSRLF